MLNNQKFLKKVGGFYLNSAVNATANAVIDKPILKEFFNTFTHLKCSLTISEISEFIFVIGTVKKVDLNGSNYLVSVENNGVYIVAKNESWLVKGYLKLLSLIKFDDNGEIYIPITTVCNNNDKLLAVHYCLFYDTKLYEFERFVRFIGAVGYTHLFIEFWGSYKFNVLPELGWKNAYRFEDIKPIINLANDLGVEVCPMFNHWGHATGSRVMHGKHVVLNQNPSLYYLFDQSGWCFNYKSQKVKQLLKEVRSELINLCGKGEYFLIGLDEAYGFNYDEEEISEVTAFINEINADLKLQGRKTIIWGDMLLSKETYQDGNAYCTGAPTTEKATSIISGIDKSIIVADWQYHAKNYPVQTSKTLQDAGFNVIICPWDRGVSETTACIKTASELNLLGIIHTTWHTLTSGMPYVYLTASLFNDENVNWMDSLLNTASTLRKVYNTGGDYEKSGFSPYDIGVLT